MVLAKVLGTREALSMCGFLPHTSPQVLALTLLPSNSSTMVPEVIVFPGLQDYRRGTRAGREAKTPKDPGVRPESGLLEHLPVP